MSVEDLREDFEFLETWEERFRYIIEMGRELTPMDEADKCEENRIYGCQSRVWVRSELTDDEPSRMHFVGDSDAQIVKGLIALVFDVYDNQTPRFIVDYAIRNLFEELDLAGHLTPSRSNGLNSLVESIRLTAQNSLVH